MLRIPATVGKATLNISEIDARHGRKKIHLLGKARNQQFGFGGGHEPALQGPRIAAIYFMGQSKEVQQMLENTLGNFLAQLQADIPDRLTAPGE